MQFGVFFPFGGAGGGALGFQRAQEEWNGLRADFRVLGGADSDPEACADFQALTGIKETCLDLFTRSDYIAFHGKEPPAGWREATPEDIRAASGNIRPDVIFTSPPCKGFSGLLPSASAASEKYQALNRLTIRGLALCLGAWADDPPGLVILENVPRITSRGANLLDRIKRLLRLAGYVIHETTHDLGEVGGLAQHRKRYLLVARRPTRVPAFLYHPPKRRVRAIGEDLSLLPMPGEENGGPMHRLPRLAWLTWVRLALIPAGGDWRDLQGVEPGSYGIVPANTPHFNHVMRVTPWDGTSGAVASGGGPGSGAINAADPRIDAAADQFKHTYRVVRWRDPAGTVTAAHSPANGAGCVADPRIGHDPRGGVFRIGKWDEPSGTIVGSARAAGSNGMAAVSDPRIGNHGAHFNGSPGLFGVIPWEEPSPAVTGCAAVSGSNMPAAVADPRGGPYGVMRWDDAANTITGNMRPSCGSTPASVADPRVSSKSDRHASHMRVTDWQEPAGTVTGATHVGNGMGAVADPRIPQRDDRRAGDLNVRPWDGPAGTVTGEDSVGSGAQSIADPRVSGGFTNKYRLLDWNDPATTVTGMTDVQEGAQSVADPRLGCAPRSGAYRVTGWDETAPTVTGAGDVHSQGGAAVADPRLPADKESGEWLIIAEDNTWHRPLTTLELAVLQGLPAVMADGTPLKLAGNSQARWRERIGNAVPVPAAQAVAGQMLLTLIATVERQWLWSLYGTAVWVRHETLRRRVAAYRVADGDLVEGATDNA